MPFGFRPDGDRVKGLAPTRAIMPFLFPTRTESHVFFELWIDAARFKPFLEEARQKTGLKITLLHVVVLAVARTLHERPRLNRFVVGGRHYQRRGIWLSFSAKSEKSDQGSIIALKRKIDPSWDLKKVYEVTDETIGEARSGKQSQSDKELALILALPAFLTSMVIGLLRRLDRWGLVPGFMIDSDPLYASMFIANLGSICMDAPFHHLYEWGNIPLFCSIGAEKTEVVLDSDGKPATRTMIPFRFTFDERVEDGFYCLKSIEMMKAMVEDPAEHFRL